MTTKALLSALAVSILGCSTAPKERPLQKQLDAKREETKSMIPPEVMKLFGQHAREVQESGILARVLRLTFPL